MTSLDLIQYVRNVLSGESSNTSYEDMIAHIRAMQENPGQVFLDVARATSIPDRTRQTALWILFWLDEEGYDFLQTARRDADPFVRTSAQSLLNRVNSDRSKAPPLRDALGSGTSQERKRAAHELGELYDRHSLPLFIQMIHDTDIEVEVAVEVVYYLLVYLDEGIIGANQLPVEQFRSAIERTAYFNPSPELIVDALKRLDTDTSNSRL